MNNLFTYLLQSGISLAVLYIIYWLFLRKDTFFAINRFFLVLSVIFSLALPIFKITLPVQGINSGYVYLLEVIEITPDKLANSIYSHLNFYQVITVIYLTGAGIFLLRFFYRLIQIGLLLTKFGIMRKDGLNMVIINSNYSPFSFFNIIFLSNDIYNKGDIKKIITHEKIHVRQKHSFDLIILELLTIIQWFNPFIWFYKSSIKNIHEFLADEGVLSEGHSRKDYQELLLNQTFGIQVNGISNNFNHSLIKRRLIMMSKLKTNKIAMFKMAFVVPLSIILTMAISISISEKVIAQDVDKGAEVKIVKAESSTQEEQVHRVVEQMPRFPGGDKARIKYLRENLKYPEEARKQGISGRVFISFVVEKDGEITNIKLLRGIGGGCDEEAMKTVSKMPLWEPGLQRGKPVRVQFNMPFSFKLDEDGEKSKEEEFIEKPPPPPPPPDK